MKAQAPRSLFQQRLFLRLQNLTQEKYARELSNKRHIRACDTDFHIDYHTVSCVGWTAFEARANQSQIISNAFQQEKPEVSALTWLEALFISALPFHFKCHL